MTISVERQYPLVSAVEFDFDELPTGVVVPAVKLPPGAVVTGGAGFVDTATNSGTSSVVDVGDADAGDLYVTDLNTQIAGESEAFDVTELGKKYESGGTITVTRTEVGAATAGKIRLIVEYIILGRANEVQVT